MCAVDVPYSCVQACSTHNRKPVATIRSRLHDTCVHGVKVTCIPIECMGRAKSTQQHAKSKWLHACGVSPAAGTFQCGWCVQHHPVSAAAPRILLGGAQAPQPHAADHQHCHPERPRGESRITSLLRPCGLGWETCAWCNMPMAPTHRFFLVMLTLCTCAERGESTRTSLLQTGAWNMHLMRHGPGIPLPSLPCLCVCARPAAPV